jgi:uncharacterized protein (DUF2132 family)
LHFLRRTPWARKKVEALYLEKVEDAARKNLRKVDHEKSSDVS